MKDLPNLGLFKLCSISFGFLGVQIAYALQSANISRIFTILGADPYDLSYFWILPPLAGIIVQPIVGAMSDRTWNRFGRRIPYLFFGTLIAVIIMLLLPNTGSLCLGVTATLIFGSASLMLMDTSINIAMQPFKMMISDMVNQKQKTLAFSIQSMMCNVGSLVGYLIPFLFANVGISNIAKPGIIPDSVIYSFYTGAAILVICVIYTSCCVKEMPPHIYSEYHSNKIGNDDTKAKVWTLLNQAPRTFWTVGLVQFFCWGAFMFMWTYSTGAIAKSVFNTPFILNATGTPVLNTSTFEYESAADWVGIVFGVQAVGSILWAICIPKFKNIKTAYAFSLILGGVGFILVYWIKDKYLLFVPFLLISCTWAAMLSIPFSIITNSLKGCRIGTYLGLFNATICIPQIVAASLGGLLLKCFAEPGGVMPEIYMLVLSGIFLFVASLSVMLIKIEPVNKSI